MDAMMFTAFSDELTKIALARWQKELQKGAITLADLGANSVAEARGNFAAAPVLSGEALDRLRRLAPLKMMAQGAALNKLKGMAINFSKSPSDDASTSFTPEGLKITVGDYVGSHLRGRDPTIDAAKQRAKGLLSRLPSSIKNLVPAGYAAQASKALETTTPADGALRYGAFRHELGEAKEALRGSATAQHASHLGVMPLLEERMALHGDPLASSILSAARSKDKEDSFAAAALKRVGGVGGHLVQPGTRQARALERLVKSRPQDRTYDLLNFMGSRRKAVEALNENVAEAVKAAPSYLGPTM